MRKLNLLGNRYGKLVVISDAGSKLGSCGKKFTKWLCQCDCGKQKEILTSSLLRGRTLSCGCLKTNCHKIHGYSKTENLYTAWNSIKRRCLNKNDKAYKYYGGRGISICDEWSNNYVSFREWCMENGYKNGLTIDRIDPNGNYEPKNCRLATMAQQNDNKRTTYKFDVDGKKYTITELSKKYNINRKVIYYRLFRLGWDLNDAITKPVKLTHQHEDKGE